MRRSFGCGAESAFAIGELDLGGLAALLRLAYRAAQFVDWCAGYEWHHDLITSLRRVRYLESTAAHRGMSILQESLKSPRAELCGRGGEGAEHEGCNPAHRRVVAQSKILWPHRQLVMVGGMRQKLGLLNRVAAEVGLEFHVLGGEVAPDEHDRQKELCAFSIFARSDLTCGSSTGSSRIPKARRISLACCARSGRI